MTRLVTDPVTKAYMVRRTAEGKTRREVIRCLKRYIAREMFQLLTNPNQVPVGMKLRVTRTDAKVTLATAATAMGTTGTTISRLERGIQHNSELARRYEEWLKTAS